LKTSEVSVGYFERKMEAPLGNIKFQADAATAGLALVSSAAEVYGHAEQASQSITA